MLVVGACAEPPPAASAQRTDALAAAYTGPVSPWGVVRRYFGMPLTRTGDEPVSLSLNGALPPGIYRDCLCGPPQGLWGFPHDAGVWPVQVTVSNAEGEDTQLINFHVRAAAAEAQLFDPADSGPGYFHSLPAELHGTTTDALANEVVHVALGSASCSSPIASDGTWRCALPAPDAGSTTVTTWVENPAADWVMPPPDPRAFTFRFRPDAEPPTWLRPAAGDLLNAVPRFAGRGEPTGVITVLNGTAPLCQAVVDAAGLWGCTAERPVPPGPVTLSLVQADAAGELQAGESVQFIVSNGAPVIDSPPPGKTITSRDIVVTGVALPGTTVRVLLDGVQLEVSQQADALGRWESPLKYLANGVHTIAARSTDRYGASHQTAIAFNIDFLPPAQPTLDWPPDTTVRTPSPLFSGRAETRTFVELAVDGAPACVTMPDVDGVWRCAAKAPLTGGEHTWGLGARDAAGNTSAPTSGTFHVVVDTPPLELDAVTEGIAQLPASGCSQVGLLAPFALFVLALRRRR